MESQFVSNVSLPVWGRVRMERGQLTGFPSPMMLRNGESLHPWSLVHYDHLQLIVHSVQCLEELSPVARRFQRDTITISKLGRGIVEEGR